MPGMKSSLFSVQVTIYIVHVCANLLGNQSNFFDQYDSDAISFQFLYVWISFCNRRAIASVKIENQSWFI